MKPAPAVGLYKHLFRESSLRCKLIGYQAIVLVITYLTYVTFHAAKRPISVVKGELNPNCTISVENNTCTAWQPFDSPAHSKHLFGMLDGGFLLTYALAMFISGYMAERVNLRVFLTVGMILTGVFTAAFGLGYYLDVHSFNYFFMMQMFSGITQSIGWPCVVESVGVWFPQGKRGLIMGVWNTHTSVGNIVGSSVAASFVEYNWGLSFIVPGAMIAGFGIIVYIFLIPDPSHVDMYAAVNPDCCDEDDGKEKCTDQPIGLWSALQIPGVIEFSLCLFFAKLVSYTFLFWLPYYISNIAIGGVVYSEEESANWAIPFDVGGAFGGIVAGAMNDSTQKPGIVNVLFLVVAAPLLLVLRFYGAYSIAFFVVFLTLTGFFVNGPYALITTAVSANLGSHHCLDGNARAMAVVTAIIDATGSLGAAVGPMLAGVISSKTNSWDGIFYMMITADICASVLLTRIVLHEFGLHQGKPENQEEDVPLLSVEK